VFRQLRQGLQAKSASGDLDRGRELLVRNRDAAPLQQHREGGDPAVQVAALEDDTDGILHAYHTRWIVQTSSTVCVIPNHDRHRAEHYHTDGKNGEKLRGPPHESSGR